MGALLRAVALASVVLGIAAGIALADVDFEDGGANKANGGQLVTDDDHVVFAVPAGALDGFDVEESVRIRYTPTSPTNFPARPTGTIWVGTPFTLRLTGWNSEIFTSLSKPAVLAVYYHPEDLGGRSEDSLRIVRFYDRWVELPSTIDPVNRVVRTEVPYGGEYGLIARDTAPQAMPAPAPASAQSAIAAAPPPAVPMNSAISGRVFYDKNGNGGFDGDDFPISSAKLKISSGDWSAETTSGIDGGYAFWILRESVYTVEVIVGPEWAHTTPQVVAGIAVTGQTGSLGVADFGMWYRLP